MNDKEIQTWVEYMKSLVSVGPQGEGGSMQLSNQSKLFLLLLIIICGLSLLYLVHPWYEMKVDSSLYIACSKSILDGKGYSYLEIPFIVRPPGFSLMIAPIIAVFGTHFYALNLYVSVFGIIGVILLFLFNQNRIGASSACLVALAVWFNPAYQRSCNQVMSDVPGMMLIILCLLIERIASRSPSVKREVLLGVIIGVSSYVRSVTILLVPAIIVSRLLEKLLARDSSISWVTFLRYLGIFATIAWVILLPWDIRNSKAQVVTPVDQTAFYSYSSGMWCSDPRDPKSPRLSVKEVLSRVPERIVQVAFELGSRMNNMNIEKPHRYQLVLAFFFLLCSLFVFFKRRAPVDFFLFGNLLVILIYFDFDYRLVLPVYILSLSAVVEVFQDAIRFILKKQFIHIVLTIALILLIIEDFTPRLNWKKIEQQHKTFVDISSTIKPYLSPDARFGALMGFHYTVFLDHPVYSLLHAVMRENNVDGAEKVIDKYRLNIIILSEKEDAGFESYFKSHYNKVTKLGGTMLFRVRP